jgi:hypothetical protein
MSEDKQEQDEPVAWCTKSELEAMNKGFRQDVSARAMRTPRSYPEGSTVLLYTEAQHRKPLTDGQIADTFCKAPHQTQHVAWFAAGVRYAEAAHGIKE